MGLLCSSVRLPSRRLKNYCSKVQCDVSPISPVLWASSPFAELAKALPRVRAVIGCFTPHVFSPLNASQLREVYWISTRRFDGSSSAESPRSGSRVERINLERAMGIEPTSEAWEASILPLYDA